MPKLRKTEAERKKEREQMELQRIGRILWAAVRYSFGSARKASESVNITHQTLCRKLNNPDNLTVAELRELAQIVPDFDKALLRECIVP